MKIKVIFLVLFFAVPVANADYHCTGKIKHLGGSQTLNIDNGFGVHRLCDISEDGCKMWASWATAAKLSDRSVRIYYRSSAISGDQGMGACLEIGTWVTPADSVYYFEIF